MTTLCAFWHVDAPARAGRLDNARLTFEKMHAYANHASAIIALRVFDNHPARDDDSAGPSGQAASL